MTLTKKQVMEVINDLPRSIDVEELVYRLESHAQTLEEMSFPDWKIRLARARRESKAGKGITLEKYLKKRKATLNQKAA